MNSDPVSVQYGDAPVKHRRRFPGRRFVETQLVVLCAALCCALGDEVAPTRDWEWIIIHHSATRVGSAEVFDAAHRARGMINGLAYHFVIDNGTVGKADGLIET